MPRSDVRPGAEARGLHLRPRMSATLRLVVVGLLCGGVACTTPCRDAESRRERRDFELDHERCEGQARKQLGNFDVGDYRSCMRVRGWCEAPDEVAWTRP